MSEEGRVGRSTLQVAARVRRMAAEHAAAVAGLCTQLGYPVGAEAMRRRIAALAGRDDHALLVAERTDGRVIGWVHVCAPLLLEIDPTAEVWGVVVDGRERGQGIGRRLMDAAEEWARGRGLPVMRLRSRLEREEAHRFYERLGYRITKTSHTFEKRLSTTSPVADR